MATVRVAVVGTGPAGAYAAEKLLTREDVEVDLIDRLPTPWGLVRAGVAPDHPKIKNVTKRFERTASHERLRFHGNVEIGRTVSHDDLLDHFHAVMYTTGAGASRRLGIPGDDLPGCHSATDFVAWYNGHPDAADLEFDLSSRRAVVVGNGNVALDVARMLLLPIERLERTDVADHALRALTVSRVREVVVVGRRGPEHAAFTTPELRELETLAEATVRVDTQGARLEATPDADPRVRKNLEVLQAFAADDAAPSDRTAVLRFLTSPVELLGRQSVTGVRLARNELRDGRAIQSEEEEVLDCGLVITAIGYHGMPVDGVPFDRGTGTIPNDRGRVDDRVYVAGWAKRGPSGIIGTNKRCANETADVLLNVLAEGSLTTPPRGRESLSVLFERAGAVDYAGWKRIDALERDTGASQGRPRVKLTSVPDLLEHARASA